MCIYIYHTFYIHIYMYIYIYICKCMCMCMMYVCFFIDSLSLAVQGRWRVVDLNDPKPWAPWSGDPNGGAWGRFTSLFYVMYINIYIYIYIHCLCMCVNIDMYRYIYIEREREWRSNYSSDGLGRQLAKASGQETRGTRYGDCLSAGGWIGKFSSILCHKNVDKNLGLYIYIYIYIFMSLINSPDIEFHGSSILWN